MFAAALGPILLPEIIILVAEFLGDDVQSISNLYKVNKAACRTLRSHLYRSVHLRSVRNATLFFQVSTISRVDELRNIRSLQLGFDRSNLMPAFEMQSDLVPAFRSALDMMHHISSLSLSTTPSVLDDLLEGFDPPFQLTEFIHSGELSLTLAKFLEKQPSIVKLGWHSLFLGEKLEYLSKLLSDTRTFLPALRELAGPMLLLSALVPRRPIIRVQVMYNSLSFVRSESQMATFLHPMGRLSSLCIMEYRPTWQSFTAFISKLEGTCVPNTLNEVHVVEAFTGSSALNRHGLLRSAMAQLAGFNSLEYMKISRVLDTNLSPTLVTERLKSSRLNRLSDWRTIVPSLESVIIHGHKLF